MLSPKIALLNDFIQSKGFSPILRQAFITAKGKKGLELKKEILMALGKTPIIKDKKLIIEPSEWFIPIKKNYLSLEAEYIRLEPTKTPIDKTKTEALASVRTHWFRIVDDIRTIFMKLNKDICIPDLSTWGQI